MVLTYEEVLDKLGSRYAVRKAVAEGRLFKQSRGIYSTNKDPSVIETLISKYPDAIISGLTALYLQGIIDTPTDTIEVSVKRGGTKINMPGVKQVVSPEEALSIGKTTREINEMEIPIYDRERMLLELMRIRNKIPYDLYREAVQAFRRKAEGLDIYKLQDYAEAIPRGNSYLNRAMEEVF